jgi:hypothetical protein
MSTIVYTIYKTTNLINGMFYIGQHKTKNIDDGYLGSGKYFMAAVAKYGAENFATEILLLCKTRYEADLAERILVVIDNEVSYNICRGGCGGNFDRINKTISSEERQRRGKRSALFRTAKWLAAVKSPEPHKRGWVKMRANGTFYRKPREQVIATMQTDAAKIKRRETFKTIKHQSGESNSCFGKAWITNGEDNKRWKGEIPEGWWKGRITRTQWKPTAVCLGNSILGFGC